MPRRQYRSTLKAEQARRTRVAIIEAAFRLFLERGYAATHIDAIARAAGVSERTVYVAFTNKVSLVTVIGAYYRYGGTEEGGDDQVQFLDTVRAMPDPIARLRSLVHQGVLGREQGLALIARMVRAEARGEPHLRELADAAVDYRHRHTRDLVELVLGHRLRNGQSTELLIDEIEAINSEETYLLLADERGWSSERYEAWVVDLCLVALRRHGVALPGVPEADELTGRIDAP